MISSDRSALDVDPVSDRSRPFPLPVERRYPLDLQPTQRPLREYFLETNRSMFDPQVEVPWASFDIGAFAPVALEAAATIWSMRAWSEFRAIGECEAMLVRMCIDEGREADLKFALAAAATDHAGLADACRLVAEMLGGYRSSPEPGFPGPTNPDVVRRALHADVDPDTFFLGRFIVAASFDLAEWVVAAGFADSSICAVVLERGVRDKRRAIEAAWHYLEQRLLTLPDQGRADLERSVAEFVADDIERAVSVTTPDRSPGWIAAMTATARAGLGDADLDAKTAALAGAGRTIRRRLATLGFDLPTSAMPFLDSIPGSDSAGKEYA